MKFEMSFWLKADHMIKLNLLSMSNSGMWERKDLLFIFYKKLPKG